MLYATYYADHDAEADESTIVEAILNSSVATENALDILSLY